MNRIMQIGILYYLKEDSYIQSELLLPIQVGCQETGLDMGIQKDDTGDNRSNRHPIYSEYSGIYWMWKNVHAPFKGVFQHRRSLAPFTLSHVLSDYLICQFKNSIKTHIKLSRLYWSPVVKYNNHQEYLATVHKSAEYISSLFDEGYDIIVPSPYHFYGFTVYEHFDEVVNRLLMSKLRIVLQNNFPQYYNLFLHSLNETKMYYANISVMKDKLFDEYCLFVFSVFDELEKVLINEGYFINLYKEKSMYRIFGYIGELLTNVYVRKKKIEGYRIKELCLLYDSSVKGNENTDYSKIKL